MSRDISHISSNTFEPTGGCVLCFVDARIGVWDESFASFGFHHLIRRISQLLCVDGM